MPSSSSSSSVALPGVQVEAPSFEVTEMKNKKQKTELEDPLLLTLNRTSLP